MSAQAPLTRPGEGGLQRKPRVGETLIYWNGTRYTVERFDSIHPEICHVKSERGQSTFIWQFHDGLNSLFKHEAP